MKNITILIILSISLNLHSQQDSIYYPSTTNIQLKIDYLEQNISSIEEELEEYKNTEKGYLMTIIAFFTGAIVIISVLMVFIVPAELKRQHKIFQKQVTGDFNNLKTKTDKLNIDVTRALHEMYKAGGSWMSVIWLGRRIKAIMDSDLDYNSGDLCDDIKSLFQEMIQIINHDYHNDKKRQLGSFRNIGGVKRDYSTIISNHKDPEVVRMATAILNFILETKNDPAFKDGGPPTTMA